MTLDPSYIYPDFDDAPAVFYCQNVLNAIAANQEKWFKIYNDKWGNKLKYKLKIFEPAQLVTGFPLTANSRCLYCFAIDEPSQKDDYEENLIFLGLVYSSGKTQLEGTSANQYGDYLATSFCLQILNRLLLKLTANNGSILTQGWPANNNYYNSDGDIETTTPSRPANVILKTTRMNPNADVSAALQALGLRGYLEIQLKVNPYEITQPSFS